MQKGPSPYAIERHGEVVLIEFRQNITDRVAIEQMNFEIHAILEESASPRFVMDMANITELSSAVLGVIMGVNVKIARMKGQIRLCRVGAEVEEIFRLVKLDRILSIDPTVEASIAAIHP